MVGRILVNINHQTSKIFFGIYFLSLKVFLKRTSHPTFLLVDGLRV